MDTKKIIIFLFSIIFIAILIGCTKPNTAPITTITTPTDNQKLAGTTNIVGTALDDSEVAKVQISFDNVTYVDAEGTDIWKYSWDTASEPNGDYTIYAKAIDNKGLEGETISISVSVNNGAIPTINISEPSNGDYVTGSDVLISGTSSDDNANLSGAQIKIGDDGEFIDVDSFTATSGDWSHTIDTTAISDGNLSISVKVINELGFISFQFVTIIADNANPSISITSPVDASNVNNDVVISGIASDNIVVKEVHVKIGDSGTYQSASGGNAWSYSFDSTTFTEGLYTVTAMVTDYAGNTSNHSININIDQSSDKPTVIFVNPIDNQKLSGFISIVGTASDDDGINFVKLKVDDGEYETVSGTNIWNQMWDTTVIAEGPHTLTVQATDTFGVVGDEVVITVDVDQTIPSINITSPGVGDYIKGTISIEGDASDNIGINKVEVSTDGILYNDAVYNDVAGTWSYSLDTITTISDGAHTLYARAIDATGLFGLTSIAVTVDNTNPAITITFPPEGDMLSGSVNITGTSSDAIGIKLVEVKVGPVSYQSANGTIAWDFDFDTTSILNGSYELIARATDFADNTFETSINILIDQNLPIIGAIQLDGDDNLEDGKNLKGSFTITGTASDLDGDDDMEKVEVQVDSNAYQLATGIASWISAIIHTTSYANGQHTINIKVTDLVGGYTISSREVVFDNEDPSVTIDSPAPDAKIAVSVLICGTAADNSEVDLVEMVIDGTLLDDSPSSITEDTNGNISFNNGYWSYLLDANIYKVDTTVNISVTAKDKAGNITLPAETRQFLVSATAPWITVTSHTNGYFVKEAINLSGDAYGSPTIFSIKIDIDDGNEYVPVSSGAVSSWYHTIDTTTLTDGLHTIKLEISDGTNLSYTLINLIVDNTPPVINITYPTDANRDDNYLHGDIDVIGTASDTNLDLVQIDIADAGYNDAVGTDDYTYLWDSSTITNVAENGVVVTAKAIDKAGNESTVFVTVDVRPYIESFSNDSALIGDTITITGDNFSASSKVYFDGNVSPPDVSATVTYIDSHILNVVVPALATSGNVIVKTNDLSSNEMWINIWNIDTVDDSDKGGYSSIVMDEDNNIYYSFLQGANIKTVDFSKYNGTSWTTVTDYVELGTNTGCTSIGIAGTGAGRRVYFAYYHKNSTDLKLAKSDNDGISFTTSVIEDAIVENPNLAVYYDDVLAKDVVYVSYDANGTLKLAKSIDSGASFTFEIVDSSADVGKYSSISLDSSKNIHISYYDAENRNLKYAYYDGSEWTIKTVDAVMVGEYSSLAIGSDDSIHISYYDGNSGDVKYASSATIGSDFTIEFADESGITGWYTSIALNSSDEPYISYYDFTNGVLKYADKSSGSWESVSVPEPDAVNQSYTSIFMDRQDLVNIGYSGADGVKLARYLP